MFKINSVFLVFLVVVVLSCKKKETPAPATPVIPVTPVVIPVTPVTPPKKIDTIRPLSYLPAYPGSYWKYSNGDTYTTSATYKKDGYTIYSFNGATGTTSKSPSDTVYVPMYNGQPLWGYRVHDESAISSGSSQVFPVQPLVRVISDSLPLGAGWIVSDAGHQYNATKIVAKDTTIIISGKNYYPTIVLFYTTYMSSYYTGTAHNFPYMRRYYTKNIGLIKEEILNNVDTTIFSEKHLVDYLINK